MCSVFIKMNRVDVGLYNIASKLDEIPVTQKTKQFLSSKDNLLGELTFPHPPPVVNLKQETEKTGCV